VQTHAFNRIPVEILRARVAQEIRTAILRGDLAPGSLVRLDDLASQLGVTRESIRQVLQLLQREGLVEVHPNHRARVAPVERQLIADLYGFREAVETTAVAALARIPDFDVGPLRDVIARGRTAVRQDDLPALIHLDLSFHTSLYEAAGNQVIVEVMRGQWSHIRRVMAMVLGRRVYREKVWDEHEQIVQAVRSGQVAAASAAAAQHIRAASTMLLTPFADPPAAADRTAEDPLP
jgi:DNA-binding GntR family transcriptional regulator